MRSRWSVVDCAPEAVQLHMMDTFLHHDGPEPERYVFLRKANGRRVADSGARRLHVKKPRSVNAGASYIVSRPA